MGKLLQDPRVFRAGARIYDAITGHDLWEEQARGLLTPPPPGPVRRVADLGCGPGMSTFPLVDLVPDATVVGVDLVPAMLVRAAAHRRTRGGPPVMFLAADAGRLPLASGSVDLVTGHSFLYLMPHRDAVLAEVVRVLRPGGALRLMEPNADGSLRRAARAAAPHTLTTLRQRPGSAVRMAVAMCAWRVYSDAVGRLDPVELTPQLEQAGLTDVVCEPTLGGLGLHVRAVKPNP